MEARYSQKLNIPCTYKRYKIVKQITKSHIKYKFPLLACKYTSKQNIVYVIKIYFKKKLKISFFPSLLICLKQSFLSLHFYVSSHSIPSFHSPAFPPPLLPIYSSEKVKLPMGSEKKFGTSLRGRTQALPLYLG